MTLPSSPKELIAWRIAKELNCGEIVNLGIGTPTLVSNYISPEMNITFQSENGFVGMGALAKPGDEIPDLINAGGQWVTLMPGAAFFDTAMSFVIIRGGHIDVTVLGALEVDERGYLANHWIPGRGGPGIGGGMDLVVGTKRVIVAMEHTRKDGEPKIVPRCSLPITAKRMVDLIVTDMAVIRPTNEGLILREVAPGVAVDEVLAKTSACLIVPDDVREMVA
jgi:acetate CoA/acetoacetate CoA-transferase beta subunit